MTPDGGRRRRETILLAAAIAAVVAACQPTDDRQAGAAEVRPAAKARIVRYLEPAHPSFALRVAAARTGESRKFVAVEIGAVDNPERHPLTFEVSFRPAGGTAVALGLFSLFPADNPGRFIVATHGRAQGEGEIVVTLRDEDGAVGGDVRAGVAAVGFAPD